MEKTIEQKFKVELNATAFMHNGELKTHPCELYEWYGEGTCVRINFNEEIEKINLPEGEYKISLVIENIGALPL